MRITLLGTGVAIPQHERGQSGIIVDAGSGPVLFDCGCGVLQRIYQSGYRHTDISDVFLSHLHLDHCGDFLALAKANWLCDITRINLWGPIGTVQWLHDLLAVYPYMKDKVHINTVELTPEQIVQNVAGLRVECVRTIHSLPSMGFKLTSADSTLLYSGDTEPSPELARASEGVDLLIHECSFPETFDVTNHTTPKRLAQVLRGIHIGRLILTHVYPHTRGFEEEMVRILADACRCDVEIGYDLQVLKI